ncbi:MAG: hypothetical protein HC806_02575 [Anaerolineae bacterium]|nr:hypothetical protein [Anaerolineae bacterium]
MNFNSVIILSTGRTGTMFIAKILGETIPNASVYHEAGERSRLINILANANLAQVIPLKMPLWAWKNVVAPDLIDNKNEFYIDSNNQLYALAPHLSHYTLI